MQIIVDKIKLLWYNSSSKQYIARGRSSAGRALEWHSRGQRFDPVRLHQSREMNFRFSAFLFCFPFSKGIEPSVRLVRFALFFGEALDLVQNMQLWEYYIDFCFGFEYNAIMEIDKGSCKTYEKENYCVFAGGFDDFFALCLRQKGCG